LIPFAQNIIENESSALEAYKLSENTIGIIDTHTHICDPVFDRDRKAVIERAKDKGITTIIAVSETIEDAKRNLELAVQHPELRPVAGLYPSHLDLDHAEEMITFIRKEKDRLIGIGEVGLDYWLVKEESEREIQQEIFCRFIDLSLELDLPLNIHSRSAGRHVISLLHEKGAKKVHLHAFDGKAATALPAVEAGYYFSVPPSVVRSRQKQKLVKQLPLSCLMVETDSPVLGAEPGQRNEPANILFSIETIAEIKGLNEGDLKEIALENTKNLYGDIC
jgi:TatD DNase family protein